MNQDVINIIVAGLGGQGVITASDIIADSAFRSGLDVKKSEIHGMSQRGGSVTSDVRFGRRVLSPMVPPGEADFLVVLAPDQVENNLHQLKPSGILIAPDAVDVSKLASPRALNIALVGLLSAFVSIDTAFWLDALKAALAPRLHEMNLAAFMLGRESRLSHCK